MRTEQDSKANDTAPTPARKVRHVITVTLHRML